MKSLIILLLITFTASVNAQEYLDIHTKRDFDLAKIPTDTFIVIDARYYYEIARRYNMSDYLLRTGKQIFPAYKKEEIVSDSLFIEFQDMMKIQQVQVNMLRSKTDSLSANLTRAVQLTEQTINLAENARKEVRLYKYIAAGTTGVLTGVIAGILISK